MQIFLLDFISFSYKRALTVSRTTQISNEIDSKFFFYKLFSLLYRYDDCGCFSTELLAVHIRLTAYSLVKHRNIYTHTHIQIQTIAHMKLNSSVNETKCACTALTFDSPTESDFSMVLLN